MGIEASNRIVVKVGTSTLTFKNGKMNLQRIDKIARVLSGLKNAGKEVILVSSGAISVGCGELRLSQRPQTIEGKQAVAAVGQCNLMSIYDRCFSEYSQVVAQILLTSDVIDDSVMYKNACNTFEELIKMEEICRKNDVLLISDEIHSDLIFHGKKHIPTASLSENAKKSVITCVSATKTFNLAGLQAATIIFPDSDKKKIFDSYWFNMEYAVNYIGHNEFSIIKL